MQFPTSMYAVIETGGKQYRVQTGDIVQVEKLEGEVGSAIEFKNILLSSKAAGESVEIILGKPYLSGASVSAEVVGQGRGEKLLLVKMKRRKQYRRTQGHRQELTQLIVTSVNNGAGEKLELSATDKTAVLTKFQSHLKPRGLPMTPKTLGSRKRMAAARTAAHVAGGAAPTAKAKTSATKTAKPAAAAKKASAKK